MESVGRECTTCRVGFMVSGKWWVGVDGCLWVTEMHTIGPGHWMVGAVLVDRFLSGGWRRGGLRCWWAMDTRSRDAEMVNW